ncbi:MAG: hypothetical protein M5R36_17910 [Deltaproteobacteria bacterium]|nr:hypothetical protein [Deltaproteobacteria bacterium]
MRWQKFLTVVIGFIAIFALATAIGCDNAEDGEDGADGTVGPQGPEGPAGLDGVDGEDGVRGDDGQGRRGRRGRRRCGAGGVCRKSGVRDLPPGLLRRFHSLRPPLQALHGGRRAARRRVLSLPRRIRPDGNPLPTVGASSLRGTTFPT